MAQQSSNTTGWVGWVYFAGILMLVRAFFQAFLGIVALTKDDFYVVTKESLTVFNFTAWGWGHIVLAIILLTAGFSVLSGHAWGRIVGIAMFSISLLANMVFLPAYPVWMIAAIIVDVLVLYALIVHGGEAELE